MYTLLQHLLRPFASTSGGQFATELGGQFLRNIHHDNVYTIRPYFFMRGELNGMVLQNSLSWKYRPDEIVFYPGMVLQTSSCINNVIIYERDMTLKDKRNLLSEKNRVAEERSDLAARRAWANDEGTPSKLSKSSYSISEVSNRNILFKNAGIDSACFEIAKVLPEELVKNEFNDPFRISVHVKWDSIGDVISYYTDRDLHRISLNKLLKLGAKPIVSYASKSKHFVLEDDITFFITFTAGEHHHIYVKKTKNGIRIFKGELPQGESALIDKLKEVGLQDGKYYYIFCVPTVTTVDFYPYLSNPSSPPGHGDITHEIRDWYVDTQELKRSDMF